jgi:hypothetical protein
VSEPQPPPDPSEPPVPPRLAEALARENFCPRCLGELDTGWECNDCDYDALPHIFPTRKEAPP